ncbi:MAG: adenylosuccinate synthase [Planctomycetota bacterium]|nr:adenylosuccinate synthase [Planctomycetota bacterium]
MPAELVLGLQWGDEGKGKIVDLVSKDADYVVRFQGGANSGHTVQIGDEKYYLHCVPSGILHEGVKCVLGRGMVLDLDQLREEITSLTDRQVNVDGRILISPRAHLVLPQHKLLDKAREKSAGKACIGTTGRGIGPCYAEKANRTGIQFGDIFHEDALGERLRRTISVANSTLKKVFDTDAPSFEEVYESLLAHREFFRPFESESEHELLRAYHDGMNIVFEGAQAVMLDIDACSYPYVTSSSTLASGVSSGSGFPLQLVDRITGVSKAYCTRVGNGPFPSEAHGSVAQHLREKGGEYGTTTNRPRRTGWIDLVALKTVIESNLVNEIHLTKLDVLSGLREVRVVVEYEYEGRRYDYLPESPVSFSKVKPVFHTMPGWIEEIDQVGNFDALPEPAQDLVRLVTIYTGVPVSCVSVGPRRNQKIDTR